MQLFSKEKETNEATFEKERAELKAEAARQLIAPNEMEKEKAHEKLAKEERAIAEKLEK